MDQRRRRAERLRRSEIDRRENIRQRFGAGGASTGQRLVSQKNRRFLDPAIRQINRQRWHRARHRRRNNQRRPFRQPRPSTGQSPFCVAGDVKK